MTTAVKTTETILQSLINDYASYNAWANLQLVNWLRTKPFEIMDTEVPSSFPTIKGTLIHILQTQYFWENIMMKVSFAENHLDTQQSTTEEVFHEIVTQSKLFSDKIHGFKEEELHVKIEIITPWFSSNQPRYELIQHCMNHSTYHRGQIITMARNLGLTDAPMTDFNFYLLMVKNAAH